MNMRLQRGFTLMELVVVIVLLGIIAIATSNFVVTGVEIFTRGIDRQHMASTGRFVVERLSREIRNAVPGSVTVRDDLGDCIEFRPIEATFFYLDAPIAPLPAANTAMVATNTNFVFDSDANDYDAIIYPLDRQHVFSGGGQSRAVQVEQDGLTDNGDNSLTLTFASAFQFPEDSPAQRLFLAREVVSFCLVSGQLYRHSSRNGNISPGTNGSLMGRWFDNRSGEAMFNISQSQYSGVSLVQLLLRLNERDEDVVLNHEIHLLQVP
ncbi:type II secretion system GspH family protein [Neiella marina]|uniref:Type II secretion system GspH family protein n=1 Tax=Neiella holothuriorum TaxID=2870530 RepID=A0ABS7EAT1_9GAMM|nr:type II secretion system protein [Neiella holothuriorum]MBW8189447.1 type II secretion system GspH family protein [Neiella holothuriorum]